MTKTLLSLLTSKNIQVMKKEEGPSIPLREPDAPIENCAHEWISVQTSDGKILKCKHCGKIISD